MVEFAAGSEAWGALFYLSLGALLGWQVLFARLIFGHTVQIRSWAKPILLGIVIFGIGTTLGIGWLLAEKDPAVTVLEFLAWPSGVGAVLAFWKHAIMIGSR